MLPYTTTPASSVLIEFLRNREDRINVLMIGNNPHSLSYVYNLLFAVRSRYYFPDFCFDFKDAIGKITKARPAVILLDDSMDFAQMRKFIQQLKVQSRTRHIPIILLKGDNWNVRVLDQVDDYLLAENLSPDILSNTITRQLETKTQQLA